MNAISLTLPRRLCVGVGARKEFVEDFTGSDFAHLLVVTSPPVAPLIKPLVQELLSAGRQVTVVDSIDREPDTGALEKVLSAAADANPDAVLGVGGGSALDVAKLAAALHGRGQTIQEVFGIGKLSGRSLYLACMPTTAGTGSEVSPNAILFDPRDRMKKAAVSPYLVPDAAYVDPELTTTLPPGVTASTALDALTHCIEIYTNRFAHPMIDTFVLEGIRLIGANLLRAIENGKDLEARSALALGSLYGGLGLGPVNTAAVHALAYPLGSRYKIAHGVSNAVLLPYVMEFNVTAVPEKYAEVAIALGASPRDSALETAMAGVGRVRGLLKDCQLPESLRDLEIPESDLSDLAAAAITVTRLLKNNPRPITYEDALEIYKRAYWGGKTR